ncbi:MAG: class I SAM-dependent methyltransferase, partial [Bacteroidales bacterium]
MDSKLFFQHLYNELEENNSLYPYYKLNRGSIAQQQFRKAYYLQRLNYIDRHVDRSIHPAIWDCGCGFGSTCFYFAMNGIASRGTTIEFYIDQIETRKKYWNRFGNAELFEYAYENLFDNPPAEEKYDYIILQDTLHHIEPLDKALAIFYRSLKKGGKLILVEENGSSIIRSLILYLKRGNKRVIKIYD